MEAELFIKRLITFILKKKLIIRSLLQKKLLSLKQKLMSLH